jgi:hypothetical protein
VGKPAVPVRTQLSVAQGYTVGEPNKKPPATTVSLAPVIGDTPSAKFPIVCGADMQSGSTPFNPGVSTSFSVLIALPNMPSSFTVGPSDTAQFFVTLVSIVLPGVDTLTALTLAPQALTSTGTLPITTGGILRQGATYTGWSVLVTGIAQGASTGTLTVGVSAVLYDTVLSQ